MFKLNNQPLPLDTAFTTSDGTQYPSNWLRLASAEEKANIGITEEADPIQYDDRFYWGLNNPKQLEDITENDITTKGLKSTWSESIRDTSGKLLAATDWMIIRKYERKVAIPADVVAYRAAVLAEVDRLDALIVAATSVEELIAAVTSQQWPEGK